MSIPSGEKATLLTGSSWFLILSSYEGSERLNKATLLLPSPVTIESPSDDTSTLITNCPASITRTSASTMTLGMGVGEGVAVNVGVGSSAMPGVGEAVAVESGVCSGTGVAEAVGSRIAVGVEAGSRVAVGRTDAVVGASIGVGEGAMDCVTGSAELFVGGRVCHVQDGRGQAVGPV